MPEFLRLKKSNCKNCYKCIRHCPVKSIRFSANQAHIIGDECILCGQCFVVCPQNAKEIKSSIEEVKVLLYGGDPVFASVAPSFAAYFEGVCFSSLAGSLKLLGFASAEETAVGATLVKRQFEKQIRESSEKVIISSCCPTVNLLIEKYFPSLLRYLSPVVSPMLAHAGQLKRKHPGARVVFIGPCLSKKSEAYETDVDAVLTFEELSEMFDEAGITPQRKTEQVEKSRAKLFPTAGGIIKTMDLPKSEYTYVSVDGCENCIRALSDIKDGLMDRYFIEMSACVGSCIGGPVIQKFANSPIRHYHDVVSTAGKEDFETGAADESRLQKKFRQISIPSAMPSEEEITETLRRMGKTKPQDELNCGSCGYNTCREKAVAVFQGKAEITMCLPFMLERTERFSNNIIENIPNGVIVVNSCLEIQQLNHAAINMLGIKADSDVLGEPITRLFDSAPFVNAMADGGAEQCTVDYFPQYGKYIEITVVYDGTSQILIALLRDITELEEMRRKKEESDRLTVEFANKTVSNNMQALKEIAALLGQSAAETNTALFKLKESIKNDDE